MSVRLAVPGGRRRFGFIATLTLFGITLPLAVHAQNEPAPATSPGAAAVTTTPSASNTSAVAASPSAAAAAPTGGSSNDTKGASAAVDTAKAADDEAAAAAAAALAASSTADSGSSEPKLNIYGFADFTYTRYLSENGYSNEFPSFYVGNLNLYAGADLGDNWRALSEVRFMYLPDGSTTYGSASGARQSNVTVDYSDINRPTKWGGISIQRVWLEHTFHPLLTIRGGQFLSPYGIWNVDHGSPVIIGVKRPYIIGEALIPQSQTGLEVYGTYNFGANLIGYHLTLSNGRGPVDTYQDFDKNKAVGGRLYWRNDGTLGTLTVGVSGYHGLYTERLGTNSTPTTANRVSVQYKETSIAGDIKWEYEGALVQGEVLVNDIVYADFGRPRYQAYGSTYNGWNADMRKFGTYGLAGYRLPLLGIMPFFGGEYYDNVTLPAYAIWGGLNVRPTARVVLKAQATHSWHPTLAGADVDMVDFQSAWSF